MTRELVIGMAGAGGDGVVLAGEALIGAAARDGYHAIMTKSFGSQIRGGESSCRVRLGVDPVVSPGGLLDIAIALNWNDFLKFGTELPLSVDTVVIFDTASGVLPNALPLGGLQPSQVFPVPIGDFSKQSVGSEKSKNVVVLGLLSGWIGLSREALLADIRRKLGKKGAELVTANERAFDLGFDHAVAHPMVNSRTLSPSSAKGTLLLADGNAMCAASAIFAGCQFFGGYPITPSTEIMQFLSREIWRYSGAVLQAEDEIAGVGAAVGASFAGKKSMTATSGPGMSLKSELLGLATIAELPLVVVNVQRGGPSTGIPTKSEQSDLFQAVFSAHGDVARPVLAPISVADTFQITVEAFNLAERYQTPVIVLSDQEIAQRKETLPRIDTSRIPLESRRVPTEAELAAGYRRFAPDPTFVSPLSHPGLPGGNYLAAGIEHDECGAPTASGALHARMNEKRFNKLAPLADRHDLFLLEGDPEAKLALISWGSTAGICRDALRVLQRRGISAKLLAPRLLFPVANPVYEQFLASVERGLVVEQSHQGQLFRLIRMFVDVPRGLQSFARSGSNPFLPEEIATRLQELAPPLPVTPRPYPHLSAQPAPAAE